MPAHAEAVEAVSEILDRIGYNGIAVEEPVGRGDHVVKAYIADDADAVAKVNDVRDALGHLQAFDLGPIGDPRVREIADEDWLESWKASFTPIRAGAFFIRPTWSDAPAEGVVLELDPGMAFGTGLHPTTQQCLEALSTLPLDGLRVLDVGTGSGILAIAAGKRGAREIVAVDTDEIAVRAAVENCGRNGVGAAVMRGSARDIDGTFDVVIANIVAPVLQALAPELRARLRDGGTLVLAGIVSDAEAETLSFFDGVSVAERDERGGWVRLTLR